MLTSCDPAKQDETAATLKECEGYRRSSVLPFGWMGVLVFGQYEAPVGRKLMESSATPCAEVICRGRGGIERIGQERPVTEKQLPPGGRDNMIVQLPAFWMWAGAYRARLRKVTQAMVVMP